MSQKKAEKLLLQVKETYNTIAQEFSDSRNFAWHEFEFFVPYLKSGAEILDLGCGNGRLLQYLNKRTLGWKQPAFHYVGIDNSEKLLKNAKKLHPQQNFILGDQLKVPLDNQTVDILFNIAAFHHIPTHDLQLKALNEMYRVLKKDGILVMTVWNLWQSKNVVLFLKSLARCVLTFGHYSLRDLFVPWGKEKTARFYYAFSPNELEKLLVKAGFEIMDFFSVKAGGKVAVHKGYNFCIVAKKISL